MQKNITCYIIEAKKIGLGFKCLQLLVKMLISSAIL